MMDPQSAFLSAVDATSPQTAHQGSSVGREASMKDFVSRQYSGPALFAALSVIFIACSIFIPFGFPWLGLAWVGVGFAAARWTRIRPSPSIHGVLDDVDAEPALAVASRPAAPVTRVVLHVAWLSFLVASLSAGALDPAANLSACKRGWSSCDSSQLTLQEMTAVAEAKRIRNVSDCRGGLSSCEKWKLSEPETIGNTVPAYDPH